MVTPTSGENHNIIWENKDKHKIIPIFSQLNDQHKSLSQPHRRFLIIGLVSLYLNILFDYSFLGTTIAFVIEQQKILSNFK